MKIWVVAPQWLQSFSLSVSHYSKSLIFVQKSNGLFFNSKSLVKANRVQKVFSFNFLTKIEVWKNVDKLLARPKKVFSSALLTYAWTMMASSTKRGSPKDHKRETWSEGKWQDCKWLETAFHKQDDINCHYTNFTLTTLLTHSRLYSLQKKIVTVK